jgi:hypothetical protein
LARQPYEALFFLIRWRERALVRFPGHGDPVVFIHGLGCASSYDYPGVATDPAFPAGGPC